MSNMARRSGIRRKGSWKFSSLSFVSEVLRELTNRLPSQTKSTN